MPLPEAIVERILCADDTDVDGSLSPDPVHCQQIVHLVQSLPELGSEFVNIVHESKRHILNVHGIILYF